MSKAKIFVACLIVSSAVFLLYTLYLNMGINIVADTALVWGAGWNNHQSQYAGSEVGFVVENAGTVSVEFVKNSKADQGIEIIIDGKDSRESTGEDIQSIRTTPIDPKKRHTVSIRHYCTYLYDPCDISIKRIVIERRAIVHQLTKNKPIVSVLGDSISTMYGSENYTRTLSDAMNYELHNASLMGSSVSLIPNVDSARMRYEKDLKNIHSASIIIFLGTNDVKNGISLDTFESDYASMVRNIRGWDTATRIFLVGILPRKDIPSGMIDPYNKVIEGIAGTYNAQYVNTSDWITYEDLADDIHPSIQGQKKISKRFENFLLQKYP